MRFGYTNSDELNREEDAYAVWNGDRSLYEERFETIVHLLAEDQEHGGQQKRQGDDMSEKYLIDGTAVEVVEECHNGTLVRRLYEDGETGELIAENKVRLVDQVFDKTPTIKLDAEVAHLKEEISTLSQTAQQCHSETSAAIQEYDAVMVKVKRREQLRRLEDFLDGKITHIVHLCPYGAKIVSLNDEKTHSPDKDLRLLCLFGSSNGNLQWRINSYRDDSGNWSEVMPCTSYEQALEVLTQFLYQTLDASCHYDTHCINTAKQYGIPVPQKYLDAMAHREAEAIQRGIAKLEQKLTEKKQKLAETGPKVL